MSLGVLEEETFCHCCHLLLQQSEQLRDGWSWESVQGSQEGYLRKTALRSAVINSNPVWDHDGSSSDSDVHTSYHPWPDQQGQEKEQSVLADEDDGVCMVPEGSSQLLQYEYHIIYSCSYNTPVLYFRASTLEGRSLSLEEVWSAVHPNFKVRLQTPLNTITQQEHPLLGQPFFMLHPCRTQEFMRPVLQAAQDQHSRPMNYVLTWLSVVGPLVGLDISLKYSTQLHPATKPD